MFLLKYIDKKLTYKLIKNYIKSFLFFGAPIGIIIGESIKVIIYGGFSKYVENFNIDVIFFTIFFDILIISPFIINYIKHKKRYKNIIKKINLLKPENLKVRALYNYEHFIKGQTYLLEARYNSYIIRSNYELYIFEYCINKFELEDIKEERKKKLKKIKKLF